MPVSIDSARDEYFARNFAWHAITQYSGELSCNCKNATIIYLKPVPDQLAKDRLGNSGVQYLSHFQLYYTYIHLSHELVFFVAAGAISNSKFDACVF